MRFPRADVGNDFSAAVRIASISVPIRSAVALVMAVSMNPGAIALQVMPNGPSSMASVLVKPCRPAFAVA